MFKLVNPWVILAAVLALAAAGWQGFRLGADHEIAKQARLEAVIEKVRDAAQQAAAAEIANIKIVNQTHRQVLEREIRTVPDYSACRNSPDGMRAINQALGNRPESAGSGVVPGANPAQ